MDTKSRRNNIHRYKVIALDVWGHGPGEHAQYNCDGECDGYTVNDAHYTGRTIEVEAKRHVYNVGTPRESVSYHADDEAFYRALVDGGYVNADFVDGVKVKLKIDGEDDGLLFVELDAPDDDEDGIPLVHLERVCCTCGFDDKPTYSAHEHHTSCAMRR